jgi:hypothetical protein
MMMIATDGTGEATSIVITSHIQAFAIAPVNARTGAPPP